MQDRIYVTGVLDTDPVDQVFRTDADAFLSLFDLDGDHQWTRTWGIAGRQDEAEAIAVGPHGEVVVCGQVGDAENAGVMNNSTDVTVWRFDQEGGLEWSLAWGTSGWDRCSQVWMGDAGHYLVLEYDQGLYPGSLSTDLDGPTLTYLDVDESTPITTP